jgi:hypothetical protein
MGGDTCERRRVGAQRHQEAFWIIASVCGALFPARRSTLQTVMWWCTSPLSSVLAAQRVDRRSFAMHLAVHLFQCLGKNYFERTSRARQIDQWQAILAVSHHPSVYSPQRRRLIILKPLAQATSRTGTQERLFLPFQLPRLVSPACAGKVQTLRFNGSL